MLKFSPLFFVLLLVSTYSTTYAASPIENKPVIPYEVMTINSQIENEQVYLGELVGDPHTLEFSIGAEMNLIVNLAQEVYEGGIEPLSIIVVKINDNKRGVKEMGRVKASDMVWAVEYESTLGLTLSRAETFSLELGPGIYRLEVSSAENRGKYMLTVGDKPNPEWYFSTLADIRQIQSFFGHSFLRIFMSTYVFYPLGIVIMLGLIYFTWRHRGRLTKPNQNA